MEIIIRKIRAYFPRWVPICDHISLFVNQQTAQSIQCSSCDLQYAISILKENKHLETKS